MRKKIVLTCEVCSSRNYTTSKTSNVNKRLETNKYCKYCGEHTLHKETK